MEALRLRVLITSQSHKLAELGFHLGPSSQPLAKLVSFAAKSDIILEKPHVSGGLPWAPAPERTALGGAESYIRLSDAQSTLS